MRARSILSGLGMSLTIGLICGQAGIVRSQPQPSNLPRPWFNCLTREVWSPEKRIWCNQLDQRLQSDRQTDQLEDRSRYTSVDLNRFSTEQLVGEDPRAIALALFALSERPEGNFQEQISVNIDNDQAASVVLTQVGLADDSVRGLKYQLELVPTGVPLQATGTAPPQLWKVVWIGQQQLCQKGRGAQGWTPATCH